MARECGNSREVMVQLAYINREASKSHAISGFRPSSTVVKNGNEKLDAEDSRTCKRCNDQRVLIP